MRPVHDGCDGEQGWLDTGNVLAGTPKVFTHMLTALQPRTA